MIKMSVYDLLSCNENNCTTALSLLKPFWIQSCAIKSSLRHPMVSLPEIQNINRVGGPWATCPCCGLLLAFR
ncbi:hypothetical protein XELAEV_18016411mg [Xenopus laevis]|uniref:Uncharacterized protein n=1 Tax=Xenopus laevis TaxID=8355 RepID=A0A974DK70_XENLA|nr:hypothetical protein XELAEV_18016411mg [Xenopus laevis]